MSNSYKCPHCGAVTAIFTLPIISKIKSPITRDNIFARVGRGSGFGDKSVGVEDVAEIMPIEKTALTKCQACDRLIFWENGELRYPTPAGIEPAKGMPESVKKDFIEAQSIIYLSPRCTCVLLRVCLEKLADHVAETSKISGYKPDDLLWKKIDTIEKNKGMTSDVRQMVDACRDTGNEFAHKGKYILSDTDTQELAEIMSELVNSLVDIWVKPAKQVARIRQLIPAKKR
jgi:hypothetical protein